MFFSGGKRWPPTDTKDSLGAPSYKEPAMTIRAPRRKIQPPCAALKALSPAQSANLQKTPRHVEPLIYCLGKDAQAR